MPLPRLALGAIELYLGSITAYLLTLAIASFRPAGGHPPARRLRTFAVVIPAHDEEPVIRRVLASVKAIDYAGRFETHVIADNCFDHTANIARRHGAHVHSRFDPDHRGKGEALDWLFRRLDVAAFDAVLIVDADAVVSGNILAAANRALDSGAVAAQVYDGVLNDDDSWVAEARALAFGLHNYVRPLGQEALGLSAGLMGNGMILSAALLQDGWPAHGLAEDLEMTLRLADAGHRVAFVPDASALAEMPSSLEASRSQNLRWEAGRLAAARRHALPLLARGLRRRDPMRAALALDFLTPPQSIQVLAAAATLPLAAATGSRGGFRLSIALLAAQAAYIGLGALRIGRIRSLPRLTVRAPAFIAWKAGIYRQAASAEGSEWVRTPRSRPAA